jgi:hypothetical protein
MPRPVVLDSPAEAQCLLRPQGITMKVPAAAMDLFAERRRRERNTDSLRPLK